jgi:multidrug resistance efflux pump
MTEDTTKIPIQNEAKTARQSIFTRPHIKSISGIFVILLILGGILTYKSLSSYISIDLGEVFAPKITISPEQPGILDQIFVRPGDKVKTGEALAHIGGETLYAKVDGVVLTTENVPGAVFAPGQAVVTMIDPKELRVMGTIDENKGLAQIKVGDIATFTVDAFGGKKFVGIVEEVSPTSKQSGVAFTISDKREIKKFTIKIKYDIEAHPEFKNGMSAKIKIFTKTS